MQRRPDVHRLKAVAEEGTCRLAQVARRPASRRQRVACACALICVASGVRARPPRQCTCCRAACESPHPGRRRGCATGVASDGASRLSECGGQSAAGMALRPARSGARGGVAELSRHRARHPLRPPPLGAHPRRRVACSPRPAIPRPRPSVQPYPLTRMIRCRGGVKEESGSSALGWGRLR